MSQHLPPTTTFGVYLFTCRHYVNEVIERSVVLNNGMFNVQKIHLNPHVVKQFLVLSSIYWHSFIASIDQTIFYHPQTMCLGSAAALDFLEHAVKLYTTCRP